MKTMNSQEEQAKLAKNNQEPVNEEFVEGPLGTPSKNDSSMKQMDLKEKPVQGFKMDGL